MGSLQISNVLILLLGRKKTKKTKKQKTKKKKLGHGKRHKCRESYIYLSVQLIRNHVKQGTAEKSLNNIHNNVLFIQKFNNIHE